MFGAARKEIFTLHRLRFLLDVRFILIQAHTHVLKGDCNMLSVLCITEKTVTDTKCVFVGLLVNTIKSNQWFYFILIFAISRLARTVFFFSSKL